MSHSLVVALSGGVGGAKLALGLSRILPAEELLIVANTGDDFEHLGLTVCPDIDTLTYALAGLDNPATGWGRRDETWSFMETIAALGGEDWFRLGDRDLALHVERTRRLGAGQSLSQITRDVCRRLGVGPRVLPMSDDRVRTRVRAESGGFRRGMLRGVDDRGDPVIGNSVGHLDRRPDPVRQHIVGPQCVHTRTKRLRGGHRPVELRHLPPVGRGGNGGGCYVVGPNMVRVAVSAIRVVGHHHVRPQLGDHVRKLSDDRFGVRVDERGAATPRGIRHARVPPAPGTTEEAGLTEPKMA